MKPNEPDMTQLYNRVLAQNFFNPQMIAANNAMITHFPLHMHIAAMHNLHPFYNAVHPAMLSSWNSTSSQNRNSPPISPSVPIVNQPFPVVGCRNNNNQVSTTTNSGAVKKLRKSKSVNHNKKDRMASPTPLSPVKITREMNSPISPPISGSSPQSVTCMDVQPSVIVSKDHSRDKQFTCKTCSRSFGYKHVLQNHERTHTGEKPFECPECHKRFTRDHHLKTHMRLHTGEKPYHCDHCDRHFVQVANLRRHMRVHTGEKPYKCEICKSTFADSNQLKGHKSTHVDEKKIYKCELCDENFKRRQHYISHKCAALPTTTLSPALSPSTTISPAHSPTLSDQNSSSSSDMSYSGNSGAAPEQTEPEDLSMSVK